MEGMASSETSGGIGPSHLRVGDIIVALALLGLLLYAAWRQFPVYSPHPANSAAPAQTAPQP
jgi:hypothetical protein